MAMTRELLVQKLIVYAGDDYTEDQSSFVEDCVDSAISEVVNYMYPWGISNDTAMAELSRKALLKYSWQIYRIAQFHYDKQGKEGVTTYYEAGQTQSYGTGGTPAAYFDGIVAIAKIV